MTVITSPHEMPVGDTVLTNKHLISEQIWNRLVGRIVEDENQDRSMAERIMDQALGFLSLCAQNPGSNYSPSPLVDIGWHTFILYTRHYAEFCEMIAGRFIHHNPSDEEGVNYVSGNIARTIAAMQVHGLVVDNQLWAGGGRSCNFCTDPCGIGGCSD